MCFFFRHVFFKNRWCCEPDNIDMDRALNSDPLDLFSNYSLAEALTLAPGELPDAAAVIEPDEPADTEPPDCIPVPAPDPRSDPHLYLEVPHTSLFQLVAQTGDYPAVLKHQVTGEQHCFAKGDVVSLHFADSHAYVAVKSGPHVSTTWVSALFKWSLWEVRSTNEKFVFRKHSDGWESRWLAELASDRKIHYLSLVPVQHLFTLMRLVYHGEFFVERKLRILPTVLPT